MQEGAYALIFKSTHFPNQIVATRKGSPLLIGIKTEGQMEDHIAVDYDTKKGGTFSARLGTQSPACFLPPSSTLIKPLLLPFLPGERYSFGTKAVEYFVASDASAIVEHTKRVLYLEDGDLAFFREEGLSISHGIKRDDNISNIRAIQTLEIELEKIMKGLALSF